MTVKYRCPDGCGARYNNPNAARMCPCNPTPDHDNDPDHGTADAIQTKAGGLVLIDGDHEWIDAQPSAVINLEEAY